MMGASNSRANVENGLNEGVANYMKGLLIEKHIYMRKSRSHSREYTQ